MYINRSHIVQLIYVLLIIIPLSFKFELYPNIIVYPQELLLPFLILAYLFLNRGKIKYNDYLQPYYFQLAALAVIVLATVISFFSYFEIEGLLKLFKYILYIISVIIVAEAKFLTFLKAFNRIAFITIVLGLIIFVFNKFNTGLSWATYMHEATWKAELMPSGFSNLIYSFPLNEFTRYSGNHGIFGSYLVLVYLINICMIFSKKQLASKFNILIVVLALINISLLTSRETLLVFLVSNFLAILIYFTIGRFKLSYFLGLMVLAFVCSTIFIFLWNADINIVLINKLKYTIESFQETNQEANISTRFAVWQLTLLSFLQSPLQILTGYGFNRSNYVEALQSANIYYGKNLDFVGIPESYFFTMLSYGGLFALFLGSMFFLVMIKQLIRKDLFSSIFGRVFLCYIIGLFITNNTGASVLADLLLVQLGLTYLWIIKNEKGNRQDSFNHS